MNSIIKTSYLILNGALVLSSCAQEEMPVDFPSPDGGDRRIVFHTSLPGITSRATEIATDLSYFHLTAFDESDDSLIEEGKLKEYFNNVMIKKQEGSDTTVSDSCVWPDPGQESDKLHFFSYYPDLRLGAKLVNGTSASESDKTIGYKIDGFKISPDIADQVDFMTAYATGSMADNLFSGINLTFRHQLSRIEVKAKGAHKSCDIEIAGVRIENVFMNGNYEFQTSDTDGEWKDTSKGTAEYIFREGDVIVTVGSDPVSILGRKIDNDNDNCAMLIPSTYSAWDAASTNNEKGMYLNVLLRIIDKTPTAGKGKQQYPYYDNSQGLNAMNIPRVYLVVDSDGKVTANPGQLYKGDNGKYYTDEAKTTEYTAPDGSFVKEFGWAALPITGNWEPGYAYTYTLDYTSGVGLHGPDVKGDVAPKAGDPIISDRVGVTVSVNDWQGLNGSTTHKIEVPGS